MKSQVCTPIVGGVTAPEGFRAAGVMAGIKSPKPDLALIVSDRSAAVAATFTTNRIQGAHVKLCKQRLRASRVARAIVINAGNANACNGPRGIEDARRMTEIAAAGLDLDAAQVLVCSTGTIGIPMPMDKVEAGIRQAVRALSPEGGDAAAHAIMTTDTVDKQVAFELEVEGRRVRLGGMAKGAGMIEPNMATLLGFLTTDAAVRPGALQACLSEAVAGSFNRITIDGDQSCNDTVLLLANGAAGNRPLGPRHPDWPAFRAAVCEAALALALKIVRDGEGATKFVTVRVVRAASQADAHRAARAVANSLLVKTAWFGGDPNWGRIIDAVGYSGAKVAEEKVDIKFDALWAVRGGRRADGVSLKDLEAIYAQKSFTVEIDLHLGRASDTVYTCDCSYEYVKINAEYMT